MTSLGWMWNYLLRKNIVVIDGGKDKRTNYWKAPTKPGIYALYWGTTLQYIGKTERKLRTRLSEWDSGLLYNRENRIPFGSFVWFVVRRNQIKKAEALLIDKYDPPYNLIYPSL